MTIPLPIRFPFLSANADLTVNGVDDGADLIDELTVDLSDSTAQVDGTLEDTNSGKLTGATTGTITFDELGLFSLTLGTNNDLLTINAGANLAGTQLSINGADGDDVITVNEISDTTAIDGGDDTDIVKVFIDGTPTADQFSNLGLTVETLIIDNTTDSVAPTEDINWKIVEGFVNANASSLAEEISVINSAGADVVRILGGAGNS